jgi:hypothetical protein
MHKKTLVALAVASLLAGCAAHTVPIGDTSITIGANPIVAGVQAFLNSVSKFTLADLTYADNLAAKNNDVVAKPCWDFLLKQVSSQVTQPVNLPPLGVATAIQLARSGLSIGSGIPAPFQAACGALILDTQLRIVQLGVMGAGVIATGGALAPAAGLGAAGIAAGVNLAGTQLP